jgi:hypothetical protein
VGNTKEEKVVMEQSTVYWSHWGKGRKLSENGGGGEGEEGEEGEERGGEGRGRGGEEGRGEGREEGREGEERGAGREGKITYLDSNSLVGSGSSKVSPLRSKLCTPGNELHSILSSSFSRHT